MNVELEKKADDLSQLWGTSYCPKAITKFVGGVNGTEATPPGIREDRAMSKIKQQLRAEPMLSNMREFNAALSEHRNHWKRAAYSTIPQTAAKRSHTLRNSIGTNSSANLRSVFGSMVLSTPNGCYLGRVTSHRTS